MADNKSSIVIAQQGEDTERPVTVQVEASKPSSLSNITGFVESNGVVAIEAEHFTTKRDSNGVSWQKLPNFGETLSAMTPFPSTAPSNTNPDTSACMDYQMYLFHPGDHTVETVLAPTLSFVPGRGLRFALGLDNAPLTVLDAWASNTQADWEKAVSDGVHRVYTTIAIDQPGPHTLHLCMVDPAIVIERLIVRTKPSRPAFPRTTTQEESYLGPPESTYRPPTAQK